MKHIGPSTRNAGKFEVQYMATSYKDDEHIVERPKLATLARLFKYLFKYKKQVIAVFCLMLVGTVVQLLNPTLVQKAVDGPIAHKNIPELIKISVIYAVINIIMILAIKARMLIMSKTSNTVLMELRQELYEHIQTLDLTFFDGRPMGKILARIIGDVNSLKEVLDNAVTTFIPDMVTIIAVVVIMFTTNARLAAAALCSLPLMMAGLFIISLNSSKHWRAKRKKSSNLAAFINEDLSGIKIIQNFKAENETDTTFRQLVEDDRSEFIKAVTWADGFGACIDLCWGIGTVALYYVGIRVLGIEGVSIGTYIAFGSYIGMFWQPIMNLSNFYNQIIRSVSGAERIFEIMDTKPAFKNEPDARKLDDINGNVTFDHVTFGYDGETQVLRDVSFDVQAGETIALVGPTGAGKSTVVNLISRFYDVQGGSVNIDGNNVKEVGLHSLRSQMGIMTQDNYIFSGTIKDNIRYGKLDATDEEIIEAAKAVHAHDFIMNLKDGYDTKLTSRGGELSNGQRQLLAFARTMISKPKILILDEATSSIDTKTEQLVQAGIAELLKGRTSFVIAHRLSTIQNADRIFVIDQGGILESGTPAELYAAKGAYYQLLETSRAEVA